CMHLCRGNFAGAWVAEGGYEPIADLLFNAVNVDGYFLEYDSARAGGFEPLRFLPKGKVAVLGLITTKSGELESKDELKRRIDEASRYAPLEQLALSPQCGFSSGIGGNTMDVAGEIAKPNARRPARKSTARRARGPAARPVVIDVHAHVLVPEVMKRTYAHSQYSRAVAGPNGVPEHLYKRMTELPLRLKEMDATGIDI